MSRYNSMEQHISIPLSLFQELSLDSKVLVKLQQDGHVAVPVVASVERAIEKEESSDAD